MSNNWTLVKKHLSNIPGWHTNRHLVIIESDDWGSIRMPSVEVFNELIEEGINLFSDAGFLFNKYDTLENADDLSCLFDILSEIKDSTGRSAVMTPLSIVANPLFNAIKESEYLEYHYEPFTNTLRRYYGSDDAFLLWLEGVRRRIFVPQFHGREHLNVIAWMKALTSGHREISIAFNHGMWGIATSNDPEVQIEMQAAFDIFDPVEIIYQENVIKSGLQLFEKILGYKASYFVPPNGPFSSKLEVTCRSCGVRYIGVPKYQNIPLGNLKSKKRINWVGKRLNSDLICITRNCHFEPTQPGPDWVGNCLNEITIAFKWHKPAVISTHRVNYIGTLEERNRENRLSENSPC